jgi:hypothetical protein
MTCAAAAVLAAYFIGRARAGIPTVTPLYYSGYLEDGNGAVSDSKSITVNLFDAASQGNAICQSSPSGATASKTQVTAGRFRIALDPSCTPALQGKSDVWIEVNVEGQALPRSKIGAVPYALTAGNIDWSGVAGVSATTEWPGTIPLARVSNSRPVYKNPKTGKLYSLDASFCGATDPSTTGGKLADDPVSGYSATKSLCEKACNNSPTAHMCTPHEIVRFVSTGGSVPIGGWVSTGMWTADPRQTSDCKGFTTVSNATDSTGFAGGTWDPTIGPQTSGCQVSAGGGMRILCCD